MKKLIILSLALLLLALPLASCAEPEEDYSDLEAQLPEPDNSKKENEILGKEGNIKFDFKVTHADGKEVLYKIESTKKTLGEALLEGSVIKTVKTDDGERVITEIDAEALADGHSWVFTKNGETLASPFDTPADNGDVFSAVYTK